MPKPLLTLTAFLGVCAVLATAQEAPPAAVPEKAPAVETQVKPAAKNEEHPVVRSASKPATVTPSPIPAVTPAPTPKPKRSFFQRLFGVRPRKVAPPPATPTPAATPRVRKVLRKPLATPAPDVTRPAANKPAVHNPEPAPKPDRPVNVPAVKPEKTASTTKAGRSASTPPPIRKAAKPLIEPPADADPEVKEKFRFDKAKARAMDDPQVQSLKAKADDAATEEDSRKALRAYNTALFEKMRKIDGSLSERIDRMEAAMLKRLNE
jgi:hypothetical protein